MQEVLDKLVESRIINLLETININYSDKFKNSDIGKKIIEDDTNFDKIMMEHIKLYKYYCINKDACGIFNAAGSPISLDKFVNVVNQFSNTCKNSIMKFCSNNIEFFEKKSDSIINTDKAEKLGLKRTDSEKLLSHILQIKCKK